MGHNLNVIRDIKDLKSNSNTDALLKSLRKINLLTPDFANTKMSKNNTKFSGYVSYILHLSPADIAHKELSRSGTLCPMASAGCKSACLNTAGRGRFNSIQESRLRKTLYFILFRDNFMAHLEKEIFKLRIKAQKQGKQLVIRLNGTSDIQWESIKLIQSKFNIFEQYLDVQFYDYTKIVKRLHKVLPTNYYLIFSQSETNESDARLALDLGFNVATVFDALPSHWLNAKVINGDEHDFRFLDQGKGIVVGLKAKGKAKRDTSGFVKRSQCEMKVA